MSKQMKIILGVIGAVLVIVIFVILIVVSRTTPGGETSVFSEITDVEYSRIDSIANSVKTVSDIDACNQLGNKSAKDECLYQAIQTLKDPTLCDRILDAEDKDSCKAFIFIDQIRAGGEEGMCLTLQTPVWRSKCIIEAVQAGATLEFCDTLIGDEKLNCFDRVQFIKAFEEGGETCASIINEDVRGECFSAIGSVSKDDLVSTEPAADLTDSDKDKLSDTEEKQLGTNPNLSDTDKDDLSDYDEVKVYKTDPLSMDSDGDGYTDKVELDGGYNPLGPGRL